MGQFGNQPDFITNDIKTVTPVLAANLTAADSLDGSIIYVGTSAPGNIQVIPVGTVGPSVVSAFSSPGYVGSSGTGYTDGTNQNADMIGGSGTGLEIEYTSVNERVVSIDLIVDQGVGYLNGDLVTVDDGDNNAVFRIVAAPGSPTAAQAVTFKGLGTGAFLPVIVDYVLTTPLSCGALITAK